MGRDCLDCKNVKRTIKIILNVDPGKDLDIEPNFKCIKKEQLFSKSDSCRIANNCPHFDKKNT
jgi:hypothetical protein